jgi:DNA-binding MarR family transcriptional regulator
MSRIVSGLERAGLVRRRKTEDGRRVRLEASAKGVKILEEARKRRVASLAKALAVLSEQEQRKLGELVEVLSGIIPKL